MIEIRANQHLEIVSIENGYIVKIIQQGFSTFTEPYSAPVFVYENFEDVVHAVSRFFTDCSNPREAKGE